MKKVLLVATGALMSSTMVNEKHTDTFWKSA